MNYACSVIRFPVTHRSVLERIRSGDVQVRRLAFGDLAEGYWRPSYHYLRMHWGLTPEAAEDTVQAFFTTAFEKGYVEKYDPAKAKFRTFLRVCLDRFVQNQQKAERAGKRGGAAAHLPLDFPGAEEELAAVAAAGARDVERFFHDETVRWLFTRTVDAMKRRYEREGRAIVFAVFDRHDLRPAADASYATVARDLGLPVTQVTNHLHAARRRFREQALDHLRSIVATDDEFRAEARDLFGIDVEP
jgi:DNA-directed RNA polymerase specialized sigma24 family protein